MGGDAGATHDVSVEARTRIGERAELADIVDPVCAIVRAMRRPADDRLPKVTLSTKNWIAGIVALGVVGAAGFLLLQVMVPAWERMVLSLPAPSSDLVRRVIAKTQHSTLLSPYFYLGVLCLFAAERLLPARSQQRLFSAGVLQDVVWFLVNTLPLSTLVFAYAALLQSVYNQYLGFLTIDAVAEWSPASRFVMFLLVTDLLGWFHHFVRHKVEVFWYFHTIHHSQREMNMFTDHRVHIVEFMIASTLIFIPSLMFQLSTVSLGYFLIFFRWYTRMYHANLKSNFGVLKHVLVTPQSHRIHHSIELRHADKNFGTFFTIWDRLFGTLYKNYEEYPDTGLRDDRFPVESEASPFHSLANYWVQTVYPFRLIYARIAPSFRARRVASRESTTAPAAPTTVGQS
jgi:sterol desaturase/sphingolipid hydroxylase (fatty acid hydroxylase superfamily)